MASHRALAAVGTSLVGLLDRGFQSDPPLEPTSPCTAAVVRSEDFELGAQSGIPNDGVSLFFYRVDVNESMRAAWSGVAGMEGRSELPLDLHFILTAWSANAEDELRVLGRAMQCLEDHPVLTGPLLHPSGEWDPGESVQVVPGRITIEEVMRTFDSLPHDYKLSVPYLARVVRIQGGVERAAPEVGTAEGTLVSRVVP